MGAGILPTCIHENKLYFLFGKENKYEPNAPGFSDFGGGTDNTESFFNTAVREAGEEFTGFLGDAQDIRFLMSGDSSRRRGKSKTAAAAATAATAATTYNIDYVPTDKKYSTYRTHIFPFAYNEWLPFYYNNNQRFLQKSLDPAIFRRTKIFEKERIEWICVDDLLRRRGEFRFYYLNVIDSILAQRKQIEQFIRTEMRRRKLVPAIMSRRQKLGLCRRGASDARKNRTRTRRRQKGNVSS